MSDYKNPAEYLKEPYARVLTPDPETKTYTAQILEFPGCVSQGDSPEEAYANLEKAAEGWIRAALDNKQSIPEPAAHQTFGGKVLLRLPRSLHQRVAELADRDGVSLNQFIVAAVAEKVGTVSGSNQVLQLVHKYYQISEALVSGKNLGTSSSWPSSTPSAYVLFGSSLNVTAASADNDVKQITKDLVVANFASARERQSWLK